MLTRLSFGSMSAAWRILPFLITATATAVAQSSWQPMPWPSARGYAVASYDPNTASVLMAAGWNDFDLGDSWRWRGNTATWERLLNAGTLTPRYGSGVSYDLARNTHVLFGGAGTGGYFDQTFLWDVATSTWQLIVPGWSPGGRAYSPLAYDPNRGRVVLFAGYANGNYGDTCEWNGNTWLSPTVVNPPSPRHGHSFVFDAQSNACMLFGGSTSAGPSSQTWLWNGTTWTLQSPLQSPTARWHHAAAYDPLHGQVVVFGGWDGSNSLTDTWLWNGATGNWSQASVNGPGPRGFHAMTFDASRGRVVLFGGHRIVTGLPDDFLSDVWEWDGTAWSQVKATMPRSRTSSQGAFHAGPTAATRHMLVYGGRIGPYSSYTVVDDTWLWDGVTWTKPTLASSPPARAYSDIVFDPIRNESVLFGGWPANIADTWVWDGTQWLQRTPAMSPSGRHGHSMTFHPGLGKVVLFGGWNGTATNDLWTWDGSNWSNITPVSGSPPARWHHAIAYDPPNNRVVLFGGFVPSGGYYNDTWAWSSSGWTQLSPAPPWPTPRGNHRMAYDPSRGCVVLVDGYDGTDIADTWELQGSQWVLCAQTYLPPARDGHVLAYDPDHERLYMFGGYGPGGDFWEAYNPWQATFTEISGTTGCPVGAGPVPLLGLTNDDPNHLPWLGADFSVTQSNPPAGFPLSLVLFGFAPSIALPLPWPGCTLYCNWTAMVASVTWPHTAQVQIPLDYHLLGLELVCQGGVLNGTAVGTTKGFIARIGTRK